MRNNAKKAVTKDYDADRRSDKRHTMVLRVAVVDDGKRAGFCLLKNISPDGVQVKSYAPLEIGTMVTLFVGEEKPAAGQVVWYRDRLAGIKFEHRLSPDMLLRVEQKVCEGRRRSLPRLHTEAAGKLRILGRAYHGTLQDISASGAKLKVNAALPASGAALLELPDLPSIEAFIRWSDKQEVGLSFASPLPIQIIADWLVDRETVKVS